MKKVIRGTRSGLLFYTRLDFEKQMPTGPQSGKKSNATQAACAQLRSRPLLTPEKGVPPLLNGVQGTGARWKP